MLTGLLMLGCGADPAADDGSTDGTDAPSATDATTASATTVSESTASTTVSTTSPSTTDSTTMSTGPDTVDTGDDSTDDGPPPVVCEGDCHYVRAGASGSGADWDDALPALPDVLEGGHVYFVAAGEYPAYTFDDGADPETPTRVVRATASDHGTDDGWDPTYADGVAQHGPLVFTAAGVWFDGRGATRIVGTFEGTVVVIDASDVEMRGSDVDGAFAAPDGSHTEGACTGMSIGGDRVTVADNVIHDVADDGVAIGGSTGASFVGNTVHALHACGTDGGCGPCYNGHSDGIEIYDIHDSEIVGNLVYDVRSTAALFFGNWADDLGRGPSEYCTNLLIANNLLYAPETGFVAYIEDAVGITVVNNVMWGSNQGAYGGLAIGTDVENLEVWNNAIVSINYEHLGSSYDAAEHHGDYNLFGKSNGQWVDGANDVIAGDPLFAGIGGIDDPAVETPAPGDFVPMDGSPLVDAGWPGDDAIMLPADFYGVARDEMPNIGAIE